MEVEIQGPIPSSWPATGPYSKMGQILRYRLIDTRSRKLRFKILFVSGDLNCLNSLFAFWGFLGHA